MKWNNAYYYKTFNFVSEINKNNSKCLQVSELFTIFAAFLREILTYDNYNHGKIINFRCRAVNSIAQLVAEKDRSGVCCRYYRYH